MEKEFNKGGNGSKEDFDLHPSLATSIDKNFSKAARQSGLRSKAATTTSATATWSLPRSLVHQHVEPGRDVGAGLLARKAVAKGLTVKPWVKTSLAPGSQVVADISTSPGCRRISTSSATTSWASAAPPASQFRAAGAEISKTINDQDLVAAAVLSGNRNFEGRVNADVRANYLASPPLVVAYALAARCIQIC